LLIVVFLTCTTVGSVFSAANVKLTVSSIEFKEFDPETVVVVSARLSTISYGLLVSKNSLYALRVRPPPKAETNRIDMNFFIRYFLRL